VNRVPVADPPREQDQAVNRRNIISEEGVWLALASLATAGLFSCGRETRWIPNKPPLEEREDLDSKQEEVVQAQYVAAAILLAAAAVFLALVFAVDRAVDFSRLTY
jgi:hypothetical protein